MRDKKPKNKKFLQGKGRFLFLIFFGPLICSSSAPVVDDLASIYLYRGLQLDYPLPDSFKKEQLKFEGNYKRYTKAVYRKKTNDIRFTPIRSGNSILIIKNKKKEIMGRLNINVQKKANLHQIAADLKDLLIAIDGIEVKIYNKKIIIDGQVLLPREMDRINEVISKYGSNLVTHLVTFSPEAQKRTAELIEKEIGFPEVTVRYAHNRFMLEGCVGSDKELRKAMSIASLHTQFETSTVKKGVARKGFPVIKNELSIPCESTKKADSETQKKDEVKKLIQIVVHFVEMEKSFNKGFLFQWSPAIDTGGTQVTASTSTVPGRPKGITAALTATVSNLFPKLNWAKSFNFARVLHNSSLLVEDGHEGGNISIQTQVPSSNKDAGGSFTTANVSTAINPKIIGDRNNLIQMGVGVQVTSPGSEGTVSRNLSTKIHVRDGTSAVIGGLISSTLKRGYNDRPPSQTEALPIVDLYSQKGYATKKSQFVIFITPLIKSNSHTGVERIKRKFKLDE